MSAPGGRPAHILAVSEAPIPSAVLGVHAPFEHLGRTTGRCELRTASSIDLDPADVAWADSIVLVRGASPAERRLLDEGRRLGRLVATYMDDDLERVPGEARSGYFFTSPTVRANVAAIVRDSDLLLVTNERLGDELSRRHGRPATLLRQPRPARMARVGIPGAHGHAARGPTDGAAEVGATGGRDAPVRIGFLGSVDHAGFVERLLGGPIARIAAERGDAVEWTFCGAIPAFAGSIGARREPFDPDFGSWCRTAASLRLDVALAPLEDSAFHACKYFNKYLEYGSLGAAGIYSEVHPFVDAVRDGETGLLVPNRPGDWLAAIDSLVDDAGLRRRVAAAAAADVEARFSERALEAPWLAGLAPLLDHRAPSAGPREVRLPRGKARWALDRLAVYGPLRFAERLAGRLTGRLRPG
ncbi:hypothetical protein KGQ64_08120 [bacterium]|nr:hypothetical protein [bacterium]